MNERSLAYNYVQNQQQSSRTGELFQIGTYAVNGLGTMSHKINLSHYAESLVSKHATFDHGEYYLHLGMLSDEEQNELVRLYLEFTDRETAECVYGDDFTINSSFTCALLAMLQNDCKETRDNFAEVTRNNTLVYYTESLNELLSAACDNFLHLQMNQEGYYAQQDMEHGDISWGRF